jgi:hypothetical protein
MGIYEIGGGSAGAGGAGAADYISATAGGTIAQGQVVAMRSDGQVLAAARTDYAAQANLGAVGSFPVTYDTTGVSQGIDRLPLLGDSTGDFYVVGPNSGADGLVVYKYSPLGVLLWSAVVNSASSACYQPKLLFLSNGNLLVAYIVGSAPGSVRFAILTTSLSVVLAETTVASAEFPNNGGNFLSVVALTAGGFALCYQSNASTLDIELGIYSNSGTATFGPATISNNSPTPGIQAPAPVAMAQLTNGNLLIAYNALNSATGAASSTSNAIVGYGIWSTSGTQVLAFSASAPSGFPTGAATGNYYRAEISVLGSGYAAVMFADNASCPFILVLNNAGAIQGSAYVGTAASGVGNSPNCKLLNDGTQFYFLFTPASPDTEAGIITITSGGAATLNQQIPALLAVTWGGSPPVDAIDAYIENGLMIGVFYRSGSGGSGAAAEFFVIQLADFSTLTPVTALPTGQGYGYPSIISAGDNCFALVMEDSATPAMSLSVVKYCDTCILGVANSSATRGGQVQIVVDPESYNTLLLVGTPVVKFDHTSGSTLPGNKGVLLSYGLVLVGMI